MIFHNVMKKNDIKTEITMKNGADLIEKKDHKLNYNLLYKPQKLKYPLQQLQYLKVYLTASKGKTVEANEIGKTIERTKENQETFNDGIEVDEAQNNEKTTSTRKNDDQMNTELLIIPGLQDERRKRKKTEKY